jgi:hypothetical protein
MSQFFTNISGSNLPPQIPTSITTDIAGPAVPAANVLVITGANGIRTTGSGNIVTIGYNGGSSTTSDGGGQTQTILTIPTTTNSAQTYQFLLIGYDSANGICYGGQLLGVARNVAGTVTVLATPDKFFDKDAALAAASFSMVASGTNVLVQVTGVAGHTIDWTVINAAGVVSAT